MEVNKDDVVKLIQFQIHRTIVGLYKDFLFLAEQLKKEGFINDAYYQVIRKRVLDRGNDCIRELTELLDKSENLIKDK